jgi:hypothetical protein
VLRRHSQTFADIPLSVYQTFDFSKLVRLRREVTLVYKLDSVGNRGSTSSIIPTGCARFPERLFAKEAICFSVYNPGIRFRTGES